MSSATTREASRATSPALTALASPASAAISTAAAASTASARATAKARALSPRVTRPRPLAVEAGALGGPESLVAELGVADGRSAHREQELHRDLVSDESVMREDHGRQRVVHGVGPFHHADKGPTP